MLLSFERCKQANGCSIRCIVVWVVQQVMAPVVTNKGNLQLAPLNHPRGLCTRGKWWADPGPTATSLL